MRTIRNLSFVALLAAITFAGQPARADDCEEFMTEWCNWATNSGGFGFTCQGNVDVWQIEECCYIYCAPGNVENFWWQQVLGWIQGQCDCE